MPLGRDQACGAQSNKHNQDVFSLAIRDEAGEATYGPEMPSTPSLVSLEEPLRYSTAFLGGHCSISVGKQMPFIHHPAISAPLTDRETVTQEPGQWSRFFPAWRREAGAQT